MEHVSAFLKLGSFEVVDNQNGQRHRFYRSTCFDHVNPDRRKRSSCVSPLAIITSTVCSRSPNNAPHFAPTASCSNDEYKFIHVRAQFDESAYSE